MLLIFHSYLCLNFSFRFRCVTILAYPSVVKKQERAVQPRRETGRAWAMGPVGDCTEKCRKRGNAMESEEEESWNKVVGVGRRSWGHSRALR